MTKMNKIIGTVWGFVIVSTPVSLAYANPDTSKLPENAGLLAAKSVVPPVLKVQDSATKKELCAQIVEISDPVAACKASKCLMPFSYGQKAVGPMKAGFKGVYVGECGDKILPQGYLLWGPENVLILNAERVPEKNFWSQTKYKSQKAIKLSTEASFGTLSMKGGKFEWVESDE